MDAECFPGIQFSWFSSHRKKKTNTENETPFSFHFCSLLMLLHTQLSFCYTQ